MAARNRVFARIGIVFGGLMLAYYWWRAVHHLGEGHMFAYLNYWNAPIGTITLVIILASLTPLWAWAAVTFWSWDGRHKVEGD